ncbi:hypothetical protein [Cryptosporangium phraense]|uniref:Uncharacterized protein n=1 Tax=Cryptosporangium phraense TaxID=2593070 RepID=A0A545AP47_9ACTN|nr:hypothetical protein [Cryptosporangium phraense]TQS43063.1 hypothetical protein FL583_21765 [Cryptosporangium phraense]
MTATVVNALLTSAERYAHLARIVSDRSAAARLAEMAGDAERLAEKLLARPARQTATKSATTQERLSGAPAS